MSEEEAREAPARPGFQDDLLEKLVGEWELEGSMGTIPLHHRLEARWTLNHQFLQLHYLDLRKENPVPYESLTYVGFNDVEKRYVMLLLDVFGGRFAETVGLGTRQGHVITFEFEYPEGLMTQTLAFDPQRGAWRIDIRARQTDGTWVSFAEKRLTPLEGA